MVEGQEYLDSEDVIDSEFYRVKRLKAEEKKTERGMRCLGIGRGSYQLRRYKCMYCSRCKTEEGPMIKHVKSRDKQYYHCRSCNTARLAKYRKTQKGAERTRIAIKKSIEKHLDKQKARIMVKKALRTGKLSRPTCCSKCNTETKIEGHHEDYTKPLEVIWVCRSCHRQLDKQMVK